MNKEKNHDDYPEFNMDEALPLIAAIKDNDHDFIESFSEIYTKKYGENFLSYQNNNFIGGFVNFAINNSSNDTLKLLIKQNFNLHLSDFLGEDAAFKYACLNNKYEQVETLLNASNMNFNTSNEVILEVICKNNYINLLKLLFDNQNKNSNKNLPFIFSTIDENFSNACFYGNLEIVQFLIEKGYIIKDESPLTCAFHSLNIEIIKLLINNFSIKFKDFFNDNINAHYKIFQYIENNKNYNTNTLMNALNILTKIDFDYTLLEKNKYPKIYSLIEAVYLEKLLPKKNTQEEKIQKI